MRRVMFNRTDHPYHLKVRTVVIQPPSICTDCVNRIECLSIDTRIARCHVKVEWFIPRDRRPPNIEVHRVMLLPTGSYHGETTWARNDNNGRPVESYIQWLDDNWKRLTGLTVEEFEAKLKV
jgi:hypothetical protein